MKEKKLLSALSYFSIVFLPVLLPIIVWIAGESEAKAHAKKALVLHLSLIVFFCLGVACWYITATIHGGGELDTFLFFGLLTSFGIMALSPPFFIGLCVIKGVQVLLHTNDN